MTTLLSSPMSAKPARPKGTSETNPAAPLAIDLGASKMRSRTLTSFISTPYTVLISSAICNLSCGGKLSETVTFFPPGKS